ncbi:MAG: hypothetical protein WCJ30_29220 [Deltaproteobacteria bacterium]
MDIRTEGSWSSCIECGSDRVLVDQYREESGSSGPVIVRRFVCPRCREGISTTALLFDLEIKAQLVRGLHQVDGAEMIPTTKAVRPAIKKIPRSAAGTQHAPHPIHRSPPSHAVPGVPTPAQRLLADVITQDRRGDGRGAVQHVLEVIDDWTRDERWDDCVAILTEADPAQLSPTASLGLLAALASRGVLARTIDARRRFIAALRSNLEQSAPASAEILMRGVR